MVKSPKKRNNRRHNPVRVPDNHLPPGLQVATATSNRSQEVLPILQKLESADGSERTWACAAVSNLIQNDPSTRRLLQGKNVVGALITRLTDNVDDVVVEASGALRNLCIDGGWEICSEMNNKNIMAPLKTFVPKISAVMDELLSASPRKVAKNIESRAFEVAENIITIFWCLSETSDKALQAVNKTFLVPFLVSFLFNSNRIPLNTVLAAAQCLYVLSEDNAPCSDALKDDSGCIQCLISIAKAQNGASDAAPEDERNVMLRVLACGILQHISPFPAVTDVDQELALPLLVPLLTFSVQEASERVHQLVTIGTGDNIAGSVKGGPQSDHKSAAQVELDQIEARLRIVQVTLDILTAICAQLPDPEPINEDTDALVDEAEGEINDEEMDSIHPDNEIPTEKMGKSTAPSLLSALTPRLISLARPTTLSFPPSGISPLHPPTTSALGVVHVRALECLNNLFWSAGGATESMPDQNAQAVIHVWEELWQILSLVGKVSEWTVSASAIGQERRKEMWDVGVGALWGLARMAKGLLTPTAEQIAVLTEYCDSTSDVDTKVKCIGTLGCLAQRKDAIASNKFIATYLFSFVTNTPQKQQTEPVLHAIAIIIDIYSDEASPYDVNFREMGGLSLLTNSREDVRRMVKGIDRRKLGGKELREFGEEVLSNLVAFVKYRSLLKL